MRPRDSSNNQNINLQVDRKMKISFLLLGKTDSHAILGVGAYTKANFYIEKNSLITSCAGNSEMVSFAIPVDENEKGKYRVLCETMNKELFFSCEFTLTRQQNNIFLTLPVGLMSASGKPDGQLLNYSNISISQIETKLLCNWLIQFPSFIGLVFEKCTLFSSRLLVEFLRNTSLMMLRINEKDEFFNKQPSVATKECFASQSKEASVVERYKQAKTDFLLQQQTYHAPSAPPGDE